MTSPLTPEERADLRAAASRADATYAAWLDDQVPAKWRAYCDALEILRQVDSDEILALLDESDAQAARIAELEAHVRKWPTLECPCCGEEGAWAAHFEDGQKTTCGCGGIVSADGEETHIIVDEADCPKCKETP